MRRECVIYGVEVERRERKRNGCVREEDEASICHNSGLLF